MNNKLFVGNISWNVDSEQLKEFFAQIGEVVEAKVIYDRQRNRSKGFGFVTFASEELAQQALEELNGKELDGRELRIDLARESDGGATGGGGVM
jgi:RNA recognition motif-containing protein